MKKRIGVYNKKIVVAGDANLAGPNEIHISELNGASSGGSSGGSGSGSGSGDKIIYYEVPDGILANSDNYNIITSIAASIKVLLQNGTSVFGSFWKHNGVSNDANYLKAFAFMPRTQMVMVDMKQKYTYIPDFETLCQMSNAPFNELVKRRISAEEYWDTNTPTFTIAMYDYEFTGSGGNRVEGAHNTYVIKKYEYELGMTFEEWTQSKYNVDGFVVEGEYIRAKCIQNGNYHINITMKYYTSINGNTYIDDMGLYNIDEENGGEVFVNLRASVPEA